MERGKSSLNPNAASYVPVSERGGRADEGEGSSSAQAGNERVRYGRQPNNPLIQVQPRDETVRYGRQPNNTPMQVQPQNVPVRYGRQPNNTIIQDHPRNVSQSYIRGGTGAFLPPAFPERRDHHSGESSAFSPHYANERPGNSNFDEHDETLKRLEMEHPHLEKDYIADVYISRCRRDLNATYEMLLQNDFKLLPEFLGIGDESDASAEAEAEAVDENSSQNRS